MKKRMLSAAGRMAALVSTIVSLAVSCADADKSYNAPVFPETGKLSCRIISAPLAMSYPVALCGYGDNLLVLASSADGWIHVYDKENGGHKGSYLIAGRGHGEVLNATQADVTGDELALYDELSGKMFLYDIDTSAAQMFSYKYNMDFSRYVKPVRQAWKMRDNTYLAFGQVGVPDNELGRFQILSEDTVLSDYNVFPVSSDVEQKTFLSSFYAMSPDRTRFANGTLFGAILETFDISGNEIRQAGLRMIYPPLIEFKSGVVHHTEKMLWGFSSLCASDDMIYSVFINNNTPDRFNHLAVFDWSGNELAYYDVDYDILRICYMEESPDKLYAIVIDNHEYYLACIDMPDIEKIRRQPE